MTYALLEAAPLTVLDSFYAHSYDCYDCTKYLRGNPTHKICVDGRAILEGKVTLFDPKKTHWPEGAEL